MRTASRTALRREVLAPALPDAYQAMGQAGIRFRRGQTHLIAAPPGGMKTALVMNLLARWKLPALVFSADTDEADTMKRLASIMTGDPLAKTEAALASGQGASYEEDLAPLDVIRWTWGDSPTYDDLRLETLAYYEMMGDYPTVIVIDNLMNLVPETDDEWGGMRDHTKAIKTLARRTRACVLVLHHVQESSSLNPLAPAPRWAVQGKISQLPELILTLAHQPDNNLLCIAAVKNRGGRPDPTGKTYMTLPTEAGAMRIYGDSYQKTVRSAP